MSENILDRKSNVISIRLPLSTINLLDNLSKKLGVDRSFIIQCAITQYLENIEIPKELEKQFAIFKVKQLIREAKHIRYLHHELKRARKYITYIDNKLNHNKNIDEITDHMDRKTLETLLEIEKEIEKTLKKVLKL